MSGEGGRSGACITPPRAETASTIAIHAAVIARRVLRRSFVTNRALCGSVSVSILGVETDAGQKHGSLCVGALVHARVGTLVYGAAEPDCPDAAVKALR